MEKVMIGKVSASPGRPVIAGVMIGGKANYSTLGSFGGMSVDPAIIYISINKKHFSGQGIKNTGYFSVNIPSTDIVQKMDYVGVVSGSEADKSEVFTTFFGSVNSAPLIQECPINMVCKLQNIIELPKNEVFIGDVVETYVNNDCLTDGKPDTRKINPVFIAAGKYCGVGEPFGTTYEIGKALIK